MRWNSREYEERLHASSISDIDVLVDKIHFRRYHQILLEHGYVFKFRSPLKS